MTQREEIRELVYCPDMLAWMDPRRRPACREVLEREWKVPCEGLRKLGVDRRKVLRVWEGGEFVLFDGDSSKGGLVDQAAR